MPCILLFLKQRSTFHHGPEGMRNGFLSEMVNKVSQRGHLFRLKAGESRSPISRYWVGWFFPGTGRIHFMPCSQLQLTSAILGFPWFACVPDRFSHVGLCNPMDHSPPGSSLHGILQARILECIAGSSSRGSYRPRDWTLISYVFDMDRRVLCH